jgi:succinyl-diaminopimelate desuccinylase
MNKRFSNSAGSNFGDLIDRLSATFRRSTQTTILPSQNADISTEDILRDLVAIPTVTGNYQANHDGLAYIEAFLAGRGMHVTRHEWNGVESLIATVRPTKTPAVFLMAHLDVVAAPSEAFELKREGGKYYGRGVLDMKGALAAYLGAVQTLGDSLHEYDFGIMITTDEEIGGFDGAQPLSEEGYIPKVLVLPDGGLNNWDMERFAKGIWWITLEAEGKVAHGSRPWEGENPIETLTTAWTEIKTLFKSQGADTSTASLTVMHAGKTLNQIPGKATASIDMRLANFEEQKRIYHEVSRIAERYRLKLITEVEADPMLNDPESPYLQAYKTCTEDVIGRKINWVVSNAGNDGRFFAKLGVPCAIAYPVGSGHHGNNEWIAEESLMQMQTIFVQYLDKVARTAA